MITTYESLPNHVNNNTEPPRKLASYLNIRLKLALYSSFIEVRTPASLTHALFVPRPTKSSSTTYSAISSCVFSPPQYSLSPMWSSWAFLRSGLTSTFCACMYPSWLRQSVYNTVAAYSYFGHQWSPHHTTVLVQLESWSLLDRRREKRKSWIICLNIIFAPLHFQPLGAHFLLLSTLRLLLLTHCITILHNSC